MALFGSVDLIAKWNHRPFAPFLALWPPLLGRRGRKEGRRMTGGGAGEVRAVVGVEREGRHFPT